jgi:hypothetical protein
MPMNLIEQQNQLRGLPDDALPNQMQSGSVPPFLVLSEISRRKTARERYEAQASKYKAAQPTVAQELLGAAAPRGLDAAAMMGGQPQAAPQGIAAAMPQMDAMATPPGYANGGMVGGYAEGGAVGYAGGGLADILKVYQDRYTALGDPKKAALKQALMAIGAGMVGGGSANFMKNVGAGLAAGVPVYQNALSNADEEAMKLLNAQADIEQSMSRERQAELDRQAEAQYRADSLALQTKQAENSLMSDQQREADALVSMLGMPPEEAAKMAFGLDTSSVIAKIENEVAKDLPSIPTKNPETGLPFSRDELQAVIKQNEQTLALITYNRMLGRGVPKEAADQYLASRGLSPNAVAGAPAPTGNDPLGFRSDNSSYGLERALSSTAPMM